MMIPKLIPYYGGKYEFLPDIYEALRPFQEPGNVLLDLFGGSGVVTGMVRAYLPGYRCWYNDLHHALACMMTGVRDWPVETASALVQSAGIMASCRGRETAKEMYRALHQASESEDDHPANTGGATIARFIYSFSGVGRSMHGTDWKGGGDEAGKRYNYCLNVAENVIPAWHALLQGVEITELPFQDAAVAAARRYGGRLVIYADPPYISYHGLGDGSGYVHNFNDDDFIAFAQLVRSLPAVWVISHKADRNFERLMGPADRQVDLHKKYHSTLNQYNTAKRTAHERIYLYNV